MISGLSGMIERRTYMTEILKKLCRAPAVSGFGDAMRRTIESELSCTGAKFDTDPLGDLIVTLPGDGKGERVMFLCPADEPGYYITSAEPARAYFAPISGADPKNDLKSDLHRADGSVFRFSGNEDGSAEYIDGSGLSPGDTLSVCSGHEEHDGMISGVNVKNRVVAATMCRAILRLSEAKRNRDLVFAFCFSEEKMHRGARCASEMAGARTLIAIAPAPIAGSDSRISAGNITLLIKDKTTMYTSELTDKIEKELKTAGISTVPEIRSDDITFSSSLPLVSCAERIASLRIPFNADNGIQRLSLSNSKMLEDAIVKIAGSDIFENTT